MSSILRARIANICLLARSFGARLRSVTSKKTRPRAPPGPCAWAQTGQPQTTAERLSLSPATVSSSLPLARRDSIPQETKERILAAARKYKYRPNFFARSLRAQRSLPSASSSRSQRWLLGFGYERRGRSSPARGLLLFCRKPPPPRRT